MTNSLSVIAFFATCHADERGISAIYENNVATDFEVSLNREPIVQECDARKAS